MLCLLARECHSIFYYELRVNNDFLAPVQPQPSRIQRDPTQPRQSFIVAGWPLVVLHLKCGVRVFVRWVCHCKLLSFCMSNFQEIVGEKNGQQE